MSRTRSSETLVMTSRKTSAKALEEEALKEVPDNVPSILELKKILPKHCFQPSLVTSMYYVFKDIAIIAGLFLSILCIDHLATKFIKFMAYPLYWYLQGTMFWAVFVLGHDCGHGSFSNYPVINDVMGNILHSFILVPYYPWKMSHHHHHKNTGNIDKDEIFYPVRKTEGEKGGKRKHFIPFFGFGLSWFMYLFVGYSPRNVNHMNPFDKIFVRHAFRCLISIILTSAWLGLILGFYTAKMNGITDFMFHYGIPIFVFATWLVVTTFLHHQDENVPWYGDEKWDFVRGNLSSVDRSYGWAHSLVHNIGTHQIHHLFIKIPHYYLEEATAVFRAKYPHLVRKSDEPILKAFVKRFFVFDAQQWIDDDTKVHVFKESRNAEKKIN
nr:omega-3 fatty acid desaturase-1 [Apocyclops royi]